MSFGKLLASVQKDLAEKQDLNDDERSRTLFLLSGINKFKICVHPILTQALENCSLHLFERAEILLAKEHVYLQGTQKTHLRKFRKSNWFDVSRKLLPDCYEQKTTIVEDKLLTSNLFQEILPFWIASRSIADMTNLITVCLHLILLSFNRYPVIFIENVLFENDVAKIEFLHWLCLLASPLMFDVIKKIRKPVIESIITTLSSLYNKVKQNKHANKIAHEYLLVAMAAINQLPFTDFKTEYQNVVIDEANLESKMRWMSLQVLLSNSSNKGVDDSKLDCPFENFGKVVISLPNKMLANADFKKGDVISEFVGTVFKPECKLKILGPCLYAVDDETYIDGNMNLHQLTSFQIAQFSLGDSKVHKRLKNSTFTSFPDHQMPCAFRGNNDLSIHLLQIASRDLVKGEEIYAVREKSKKRKIA